MIRTSTFWGAIMLARSDTFSRSLLMRAASLAKRTVFGRAAWSTVRGLPIMRRLASSIRQDDRVRDLAEISRACLPQNDQFAETLTAANAIEGMTTTDFSMGIMDSLMTFQRRASLKGNMLELGVYRGRTALLMGRQLQASERIVLVDVEDLLDRRAIASFSESVDYLCVDSRKFRSTYPTYERRTFRFVHIDASHAFRATFNELKIADALLARGGIIALDDFGNFNFSQNAAAIFKYLFTARTDLTPFLVTDSKAYLCRRPALASYAAFVLDNLIAEMKSRGFACCLARTDTDEEYSAFYARTPQEGEGDFYATHIYKGYLRYPL
jgi:predicted O-methyltransferase YrrM